jgi:hypothetical protein
VDELALAIDRYRDNPGPIRTRAWLIEFNVALKRIAAEPIPCDIERWDRLVD